LALAQALPSAQALAQVQVRLAQALVLVQLLLLD
jgi:hypothetical protein